MLCYVIKKGWTVEINNNSTFYSIAVLIIHSPLFPKKYYFIKNLRVGAVISMTAILIISSWEPSMFFWSQLHNKGEAKWLLPPIRIMVDIFIVGMISRQSLPMCAISNLSIIVPLSVLTAFGCPTMEGILNAVHKSLCAALPV